MVAASSETDEIIAADIASELGLAEGVAFTHELAAAEIAAGMLGADDDLVLWAWFAIDGLPLAGGGEVRATTFLDLPPGAGEDLTVGQRLTGQMLTGPDGWLAAFSAGDLISARLRDGALELSVSEPPGESADESSGRSRLQDACAITAIDALKKYAAGAIDYPFAPLHQILLDLLDAEPAIFGSPAPPLSRALYSAGLEAFGDNVGLRGTPWNLASIDGLGRAEAVAAIMTISMLLTWSDDDAKHAPKLLRDYLTFSPQVIGFAADEDPGG